MNQVFPNHYDLRIKPDFKEFNFEGFTSISLTAKQTISSITLNAVELEIISCTLIYDNNSSECSCKLDYNTEEMHIKLPTEIKGNFVIKISYTGKIEDNLKGLYKTSYKVGEEKHVGAITQFETEDARRMFPCFDEPGMKATFSLEAIIDDNFQVISNTPIISEKKLKEKSKKEVKFEKTPKMSTYLLFLGIAEFESISEMMNAIEINVITHPGLTKFGKDALDFSKKSLSYCQTYFDIPYPLPKLDLIATPDFAAGAMENWGAISFREDLLLTFPGFTTKINEMIIKVVIAHEITHQWFGNYVSPSIWKYIWLNESFAEFFANKIVDHFYPDLKLWDHVVEQDISVAFLSDAYHETVPIEIKSQKKTSYNIKSVPIIYNKGGAILRMVENFVEDKFFQKGLQLYLNKHAYNVASSDDLWESLEKASNKPISKLMKTWVLQPGYPLITVNCDGNTLELSQERFTYLANDDKSLWLVPITILFITENNDQIERKFLLDKKTDSITVDFNFSTFKVNFDVTGFYRVNYALTDLQNLGTLVSQSKLSTLDSWNLENDLFALFKAEKLDLEYYLEFIQNYKSISLYTAIPSISEHLVEIYLLASGKSKQAITNQGVIFHERILESIHYTPQENEPFSISIMRNLLILHASYLGSPKAIKFALEQFEIIKSGKEINPDIINAVYSIAARQGNDLNWFLNRLEKAQNEVEIITLGNVLGEFSNPEIIDEVLNEVVFTKIPMRNRSGIIWRLCKNPNSIKKMWKFFIANLDNIGKLHESIQERVINNVVSYSVDEETKQDMQKFFTEFNKTNELAKITTEKSFETLEINLRLKKRLK